MRQQRFGLRGKDPVGTVAGTCQPAQCYIMQHGMSHVAGNGRNAMAVTSQNWLAAITELTWLARNEGYGTRRNAQIALLNANR